MANDVKSLMKLTKLDLISLGSEVGLTFHNGMRKVDMVQQLSQSVASGWMDVNAELLGKTGDIDDFDFSGDSSMLSDAAHIAQTIASAGFTESFHEAMNGPMHHVEAVQAYLNQLGVSSDDVWLHMPKQNQNIPARPWGQLNSYMRDNLIANQDMMQRMSGHYSDDIMSEYATNMGNVQDSYEHLAHMYLDKSQYLNQDEYQADANRIASRLSSVLGPQIHEVAAASAMGSKASYMDILPQIGDPGIVGHSRYPRAPLNVSGLPLGSYGGGINPEYSLAASLTGTPGYSEASKSMYKDVSGVVKSLAQTYRGDPGIVGHSRYPRAPLNVLGLPLGSYGGGINPEYPLAAYRGDTGMNARKHVTSDRDMILDSASRYEDIFDARHGYENLKRELADEPSYSASSIRSVLENSVEYNEAETKNYFDPAMRLRSENQPKVSPTSTDFTAKFGEPTNFNVARDRRESIAIADLDASVATESPIKFHDLEQGSDEWLEFRKNYDITGSTIGSYLGNNAYTRPWAEMMDKVGLSRGKDISEFQKRMFAAGHKTEEEARERVSKELGVRIQQTGAITNDNYPSFMYSPDGLIGDDAIWEHKNPERAGKYADLLSGDHPDYMDQVQLGMLVSGRSRALFSQTIGGETKSQWIDRDETWYERNRNKIDSTIGRLNAGRAFIEEHGDLTHEELKKGVRNAMQGDGIWKDVSQRSNRGYSPDAGTPNDPFIGQATNSDADFNDVSTSKLALAVKTGILSAQEESRQKRPFQQSNKDGSLDDALDEMLEDAGYYRAGGGGRRGGGGGGGRNNDGSSYYDDFGKAGGMIASGIAGGSLASMSDGAMNALMLTPWGRAAALGIGAAKIGNEALEGLNDFYGDALDNGVTNPNEFSSMSQGLEMLGLNSQQAGRLNQTTHDAYNTMLNGDPSAAVNIVKGTRGLITIGDIRHAEGDPVALARVFKERAAARGWSPARIAGAARMAGLDGMARAADRTEYSQNEAERVVQQGRDADTSDATAQLGIAQTERATILPSYNVPQAVMSHGSSFIEEAGDVARNIRFTGKEVTGDAKSLIDFIAQEESGNRDYDSKGNLITSPTGAKGRFQVLDSTARNPGFGVKPAQDGSVEERNRVGIEYFQALGKHFGNIEKAMAAYTDGPGAVSSAVDKYGDDWLSHMPAQAQKRVSKYREWKEAGKTFDEGASGFTRNGASYGQTQTVVNINLNAKVNNQQASATVSVPGGQTVSQQVNMGNGAMQKQ